MMKEKLTKILEDALGQIDRTEQLEHLNDVKVAFLGKKGELTSVLKSMKDVAPEARPKVLDSLSMRRALRSRRDWKKNGPLLKKQFRKKRLRARQLM